MQVVLGYWTLVETDGIKQFKRHFIADRSLTTKQFVQCIKFVVTFDYLVRSPFWRTKKYLLYGTILFLQPAVKPQMGKELTSRDLLHLG